VDETGCGRARPQPIEAGWWGWERPYREVVPPTAVAGYAMTGDLAEAEGRVKEAFVGLRPPGRCPAETGGMDEE